MFSAPKQSQVLADAQVANQMFSMPKQSAFDAAALEEARKYSLHLNADMSQMAAYPSLDQPLYPSVEFQVANAAHQSIPLGLIN